MKSDKFYDIVKIFALCIAPICTFIGALVDIWGIPYGAQIVATIAAFDVLCGAIVTIMKVLWEKEQKTLQGGNNND